MTIQARLKCYKICTIYYTDPLFASAVQVNGVWETVIWKDAC